MYRSGTLMAWNVFKFCTALRGLGSIMILLVLGVVGATYYAVVVSNYAPDLYQGGFVSLTAVAVLILFHLILVMLLWSYFTVVFTDPGSVPPNWKPLLDEERGDTDPLTGLEFGGLPPDTVNPRIRYCRKCNQLKPPRCHHRSVCELAPTELVMLLWSYFTVVFTDPGSVPPNWKPLLDEERGDTDPLIGSEFGGLLPDMVNPRIRYCRKCNQLKPPRCHHCSVCGRCVLKMDHHCVWVVNCVGALNYKYFLLFLFYTFLETTLVTLSLLPHFIAFFSEDEIPGTPSMLATTFLAFVLNLAFALSVLGFLIMHISLVSANTTTIEAYEKKTTPKWRYDLGRKKNFEQVFGMDKRYWFVPCYSEEDLRRMPALQGLEYPSKPDLDAQEF